MSKLETILILVLIFVLLAWMSVISYLIISIYINNRKNSEFKNEYNNTHDLSSENIESKFQTDFFNKSANHAEKVLFNNVFIQEYGESSYYGNKLLDVISRLNDETKKSILVAMKYMCIEPISCRNNEQSYRMIAEQEKVPVWFIILREATKKVVPQFFNAEPVSSSPTQKDNVIPLYQKTG